jgi:hypothetical protein
MTTDKKPRQTPPKPTPDSFAQRLTDTMQRLNLDETRAAGYLGVPVFTLRKWITGEREPGAAVVRLLDVLGLVEALAPGLHDSFVPAHVGGVKKSTLKNSITENQP